MRFRRSTVRISFGTGVVCTFVSNGVYLEEDMDDKNFRKNDEIEIDLGRVLRAVMDHAWMVALATVLCAVITIVGTFFLITPQYVASAKFYVNNSSLSVGDASFSISSGDLSTSRSLVDSYIVILNTRETLNDVVDYAGVDRTYDELTKMISAGSVNETEIFRVSVTSPDPGEAEQLANAIAYILPKRIGTIIDGTSAKVVEAAVIPSSPSSPSYVKNAVLGFLLGFVLSVGVIILREIFDITVRTEEDVAQSCKYPILATVPDMAAPSKGSSYYYGYGSKRSDKKKTGAYTTTKQLPKQPVLMGEGISFAASEAYKLLRTKLQFSFSDQNESHVIGISSALSGEGKSLSSVNLAYTLSQLNKKVVLIDCDMRRPTLAEKLHIKKTPGLSSLLTGQSNLKDILQCCGLKNREEAFYVISAGQNPPNPVELLSSGRMAKTLEVLRTEFDYIIIDLPPVGEVSDAMAVAKQTDGMLLVVRQNYCDRVVLAEAVRQFEFIETKILGVVVNCTSEHEGKYGKGYYRRYYKKYYKKYGKNYASNYENNDRSVAKSTDERML